MVTDFDREYRDPNNPEKEFHLPERLDLEVTGKCHMRCDGCWGPRHNDPEPELRPEQWLRIVRFVDIQNRAERFNVSNLASDDARVCITGGEPLLYKDLVELARLLNQFGTHTTLSTTGYDPMGLLPEVLPFLQEVGIPLDGPDPTTNALWRRDKDRDGGFERSLQALLDTQLTYPNVELTVRTLIHPLNIRAASHIPMLLHMSGIDTTKINWKLYSHNGNTGPRVASKHMYDHLNLQGESAGAINVILSDFEDAFKSVILHAPETPQYRMLIGPTGQARIIIRTADRTTQDVPLGNIWTDPVGILKMINELYPQYVLRASGRAVMLGYLQMVEEAARGGSSNPVLDGIYTIMDQTSAI